MTDKLRAAMQQALEALEELHYSSGTVVAARMYEIATAALREALDHSGEANEMVAEQERAPITEPVVPWLSHKVAEQAEQEPVAWQGAEEWEPLAFQLCADENGEESCNELLWDGGVIPEPWGERWLKYEDEAKRMIEYVRKYAAPVRTKDLTDDEIDEIGKSYFDEWSFGFARAVIAADREKNK